MMIALELCLATGSAWFDQHIRMDRQHGRRWPHLSLADLPLASRVHQNTGTVHAMTAGPCRADGVSPRGSHRRWGISAGHRECAAGFRVDQHCDGLRHVRPRRRNVHRGPHG